MIVQTLDTVFQACTAAINTQPFYYRGGRKSVLNWQDDPRDAEVMWIRPFMGRRFNNKLGVTVVSMDCLLHFVINNYLSDSEQTKVDIVDANYNAFLLWRAAFEASTINPYEVEYEFIDIYDKQDATRTGLYVRVIFKFNTTLC